MFGCQIFVENFIFGGTKGYSFGSTMSIEKVPPSYGEETGPLIVPLQCAMHPAWTSACSATVMPPVVSF